MNKKVLLLILDGWGIAQNKEVSAIDKAHTPFIDSLYKKYANSTLDTSGLAVGLPEGQMGNSEVGHMNLGAGRVVYQDLVRINKAVEDHSFHENPILTGALKYARENGKNVHLLGLVSDGGVHSHINHAKALCNAAKEQGVNDVYIHAFTDGRDTDPKSGLGYLKELQDHLKTSTGNIASVIGRYYAMDRDNRWERVREAYDLLVKGKGQKSENILNAVKASYNAGITDEFLKPIIQVDEKGDALATIKEDDVVIFFNFRTDRGRELTIALSQRDFPEYEMHTLPLYFVTMARYDDSFKNIKILFEKDDLKNTIGEILAKNGKTQIRIAETEKYPHVTFFFSGGREKEFEGEKRILCPSPKVATYDLKPEMSAYEIRNKIVPELKEGVVDFVCLNFANPDMVGHTGDFNAAVKACEVVDECTKEVVEAALSQDYSTLIIADHGNADFMYNEDGSVNTAHTTNPVPCILVDKSYGGGIKDGKLGDIAPTILALMGVNRPEEMTGEVLLKE
ncbi:MAG: 2,3-bisphosphoglycerate-independent phosphoglycerate mutase [Candidatus Cyclobacteriaceae bacterium M2_1C_046]